MVIQGVQGLACGWYAKVLLHAMQGRRGMAVADSGLAMC